MNIHIATGETYMIDSIPMQGFCPVCCKENQSIDLGMVEYRCRGCGCFFSSDDLGGTVRKRRELLALSRKEIGLKLGLTRKTISNYENVWPSKKYWQETEKLMKSMI